jgi:hypothetical protein
MQNKLLVLNNLGKSVSIFRVGKFISPKALATSKVENSTSIAKRAVSIIL